MAHHQWAHFLGKAGRSLGHCCLTPIKAPLSQPDDAGGADFNPPVAVELATSISPCPLLCPPLALRDSRNISGGLLLTAKIQGNNYLADQGTVESRDGGGVMRRGYVEQWGLSAAYLVVRLRLKSGAAPMERFKDDMLIHGV